MFFYWFFDQGSITISSRKNDREIDRSQYIKHRLLSEGYASAAGPQVWSLAVWRLGRLGGFVMVWRPRTGVTPLGGGGGGPATVDGKRLEVS